MNRRTLGASYEQLARRYLERQAGLRFIAANVAFRGGELDLIMRDGQTWVFVEVRYRKNAHFGTAAETVTRQKQRRVLLAAALWLAKRNQSLATANCRFDIVAITGDQVDWLPGAFSGE